MKARVFVDFWSGFLGSPDYLRSAEMTEVMMNTPSMEEIGLSPRKDGLSYQVSPFLSWGPSGTSEPGDFRWGWRQMWFCIPVPPGTAVRPWETPFLPASLSFFVCKMGQQ